MFKFENINNTKPAEKQAEIKPENEEKSVLSKIRSHSNIINPALQALAAGSIFFGGLELGKKINDDIKKDKAEKTAEISRAALDANKYLIDDTEDDKSGSLIQNNQDLMTDVALSLKNDENINRIIKSKSSYNSLFKNLPEDDSFRASKTIKTLNAEFDKAKKELSEDEKKIAREKISEMVSLIEKIKLDLISHVKSDTYLEKLSKEMHISQDAARKYQDVRLQNFNNLKYEFKHSAEIFMDMGGFYYAYYSYGDDKIILPYDIDLKNKEVKDYFCEAVKHEFLHGITRGIIGMSEKSKEVLKNAFKNKGTDESRQDSIYYSKPQELIVRKQFLDKWMDDTNFKKYDEEFTADHYKKLLELKEENKLPQDITDLINHIEPGEFVKIMNELAELEKTDKNDKTYYHSGWDYGTEENKV